MLPALFHLTLSGSEQDASGGHVPSCFVGDPIGQAPSGSEARKIPGERNHKHDYIRIGYASGPFLESKYERKKGRARYRVKNEFMRGHVIWLLTKSKYLLGGRKPTFSFSILPPFPKTFLTLTERYPIIKLF